MRLLRKRDHHDRQSLPRPEPESHRRADPAGHVRRALPLLHAYPDAQSQSHPANFNHNNLAQAAATAREALMRLASERLGVPVEQLAASNGVIRAKNDPAKLVSYAQLVGGKKFSLTVDRQAGRKDPKEW